MSLRFGKFTVHRRPIIYAFCTFNITPTVSEIEPDDSRIVEDLIWKSIRFRSRHGENTFWNRRNGSSDKGNEACEHEAQTDLNIEFSGGIHIEILKSLFLG